MSCVYVLTNKINGKKYVGQTTKTFEKRLKQHLTAAKNNIQKISRAFNKYGVKNFDT